MKQQKYLESINRIVIGDVGSGKTIVAFLVATSYLKSLNKAQVCLLAPTEVLAYQHYQKLNDFLAGLENKNDPDCGNEKINDKKLENNKNQILTIFLTSKQIFINQEKTTKSKLKKRLQELNPSHIFWVGTHALLFSNEIKPDMVLVDEQHRFGVKQRQMLTQSDSKNDENHEKEDKKELEKEVPEEQKNYSPHFISFTATPIPRTLALTVYQQLQPHFLENLSSRKPIKTKIESLENLKQNIIPAIEAELKKDRKVYVICPQIEPNEEDKDIWSVKKAQEYLEEFFSGKILLVHGKDKQKKEILDQFKQDKTKPILISTTVIEVGVDVPTASLIVIMNAERFGLSALHQIRGRVGRNDFDENFCILATPQKSLNKARLQVLTNLQNGFEIAEEDLKLRGSGDLIGKMQSGFGSDIDELVGLDPDLYQKISEFVGKTDLNNLPRLKKYLENQAKEVWNE